MYHSATQKLHPVPAEIRNPEVLLFPRVFWGKNNSVQHTG